MATNESVFPLEIFNRIIEIVGKKTQTSNSVSLELILGQDSERLSAIHACSLVCKAFAHFTRPFIFQQAIVGFNQDSISERLLQRLMRTMKSKPDFVRYIRDMLFDFENTYPGPLMPHRDSQELTQSTDFLLNIPDLRSLSLSYSYATYNPADYYSTTEVTRFCEDIIEVYAGSKSSLQSLHAKKIGFLPFPTIFGCNSLHTLSLDRCQWPTLKVPIPHLISLKLRKIIDPIPIVSLLYLPNLENLDLEQSRFDELTKNQRWHANLNATELQLLPPFKLTVVSLCTYYGDSLFKLSTFLRHYAEKQNLGPLNRLSSLFISVNGVDFVPDFIMMPFLQHLAIRVDTLWNWHTQPSLSELKLAENLSTRGTLPSLVSLDLRLTAHFRDTHHYVPIITSLGDFLSSVAPDFSLQRLTVVLNAPFDIPPAVNSPPANTVHGVGTTTTSEPTAPSDASFHYETLFWSSLLSFVGNCINIPSLQTLTLEVRYSITNPRPRQPVRQRTGSSDGDEITFSIEVALQKKELEDAIILGHIADLRKAISEEHVSTCVEIMARIDENPKFSTRRRVATIALKFDRKGQ